MMLNISMATLILTRAKFISESGTSVDPERDRRRPSTPSSTELVFDDLCGAAGGTVIIEEFTMVLSSYRERPEEGPYESASAVCGLIRESLWSSPVVLNGISP